MQSSAISSGQFSFYVLSVGTLWSFWPEETKTVKTRDLCSLSETPPEIKRSAGRTTAFETKNTVAPQELVSKFTRRVSARRRWATGWKAAGGGGGVLWEQVYWNRLYRGNLGRNNACAGEERHCECVCTCVTSRDGERRIHSLICFSFSFFFFDKCYWRLGWVWISSTTDLIRSHLSRDSEGTRRFPQLLKPDVWFYLSFLQGKQIETCFSHGNAKNLSWGNWEWTDLFCLRLENLGLWFILSFELIYHLYILRMFRKICLFMYFRGYSDLYSYHQLLLPLVWPLLFTFKCWMKELQHDVKK